MSLCELKKKRMRKKQQSTIPQNLKVNANKNKAQTNNTKHKIMISYIFGKYNQYSIQIDIVLISFLRKAKDMRPTTGRN